MTDRLSEQTILENVYQPTNKTLAVESYGYDGTLTQRPLAPALAMKVVVVGTLTYLAIASPGTAQNNCKVAGEEDRHQRFGNHCGHLGRW